MSTGKLVGLIVALPLVACAVGLLFGIAPCYVLEPLGVPGGWCGSKSAPPHFVAQFCIGAFVGAGVTVWLFLRRRRPRPAPLE